MAKKYNYYLVRTIKDGFLYSRGEPFEVDFKGLALVRIDEYKDLVFKGLWSIIDIKSGLFLVRAISKKKCLEIYKDKFDMIAERLESSRHTDTYRKRCEEIEIERKNWRDSGYRVEE